MEIKISDAERAENKRLIEEYPFLMPHNRWTDEIPENFNYEYTELDAMPDGWRKAFGEQMCKEIKNALEVVNILNKYRIMQIKEKYGGLRWYDNFNTPTGYDIIHKYEKISKRTCIQCGKPATRITTGWIAPYCDECIDDALEYSVPLDEYFDD